MLFVFLWLGALIPTFLVSRLILMLVKRANRHKLSRLAFAHGFSLFVIALLHGFLSSEGGFDARVANIYRAGLVASMVAYGPPQAFWLVVEYFFRKRRREEGLGPLEPPSWA